MAVVALGVRTFLLAGALVGPAFTIVPAWRARYFDYGARTALALSTEPAGASVDGCQATTCKPPEPAHNPYCPYSSHRASFLKNALAVRVPHAWFKHFYIFSTLLSAFWLQQLLTCGPAVQLLARLGPPLAGPTPTRSQVLITSTCLLLQGLRRLYECLFVLRPSTATMPGIVYLAGIAYYAAVGVAVWIDGAANVVARSASSPSLSTTLQQPTTLLGLTLFAAGSLLQFAAHAHLASLPKYTPPQHAGRSGVPFAHLAFRYVVCPHYAAEALVYAGLALVGAPEGRWANATLVSVVAFTLGNLGAVSAKTRAWERAKFGEASVRGRWRMVPGVW